MEGHLRVATSPEDLDTRKADVDAVFSWLFAGDRGSNARAQAARLREVVRSRSAELDPVGEVSFYVGRSIGAAARRDSVAIPPKVTGMSRSVYARLSEAQRIVGHPIAGKGTSRPIHSELDSLREQFPDVPPGEWTKMAGNGYIDDMGVRRLAHLHWYECDAVGRVRMKVDHFM